jgi:membrane-bound lytic murein transglycosylase B
MIFRERYSVWIIGSLFFVLLVGAVLPQTLFAQALTDNRRAELQAQLDQLEKDIAANQATVDSLAAQGKSLSNEVKTLNAQIKKSQLQVQATQVAIKSLDSSISVHQKTIGILTSHLDAEKESLAQILRKTNEIDQYSVVEIALAQGDLSTMLGDLDSYVSLKRSLGKSYEKITGTKLQTQVEKTALEDKRAQQEKIAQAQLIAKKLVQDQQKAKQDLLTTTKGQESAYKQVVAAKQKTAGQIRAELFAVAGGSGAIPLPTAIAYAKTASKITGVRPALILAILKQESNLGVNTGGCLVTDLTTGDGKGKNTGTFFSGVMATVSTSRAKRDDTGAFKSLMDALGRDWTKTAVSCPQPGGFGGAMGPTQFIPTTWVGYQSRIKSALGVAATDPWNNLHAIVATGLFLADRGAAGGNADTEHTAAARYNGSGIAAQIYADSVMNYAAQYQADIDTLGG